jgi:hypothetical protein
MLVYQKVNMTIYVNGRVISFRSWILTLSKIHPMLMITSRWSQQTNDLPPGNIAKRCVVDVIEGPGGFIW